MRNTQQTQWPRDRTSVTRRRTLKTLAAVGLGTAVGVGPGSAQGGDGTAREQAIADKRWEEDHERVRWRTDIDAHVWSRPTLVDGTIFLREVRGGTDRPEPPAVYAFDAKSGERRWTSEDEIDGASALTVVDGTVFAGSTDNTVYALDADSGETTWTFETDDAVRGSPTVIDGTVFVGSADRHVYALDADSGERHWDFEADEPILSSLTVVDDTVFVPVADQAPLYALDAASGERRFQFEEIEVERRFAVSAPTVSNGSVYVVASEAADKESGMARVAHTFDADSGTHEWSFEISKSGGTPAPTVADGRVLLRAAGNETNAYALDAETGEKLWAIDIDGWNRHPPTVVGDTVFFNGVAAVDVETGQNRWTLPSQLAQSMPIVVDGTLYVVLYDTLYALDAGIEGSSDDSLARQGTMGHHDDWLGASASGPGFGAGTALAALGVTGAALGGAGYFLKRQKNNLDAHRAR